MKLQDFMGLSGRIKFDTYGKRTDFQLNVLELTRTGLETIGNNTAIKKAFDIARHIEYIGETMI